jgi:hypothetical protein
MPRSSLTASLLQSGYKLVNQGADRLALPENYRAPIPQPHPNDNTQWRGASATTPPGPPSPIPVGRRTFYPGGHDMMTNLRIYYVDANKYIICGIKIGYPDDLWTKVMGKKTNNVEYWDRQDNEKITFIDSRSALSVYISVAII